MSVFLKSIHNINRRTEAMQLTEEERLRQLVQGNIQPTAPSKVTDTPAFEPFSGIYKGHEGALLAPTKARQRAELSEALQNAPDIALYNKANENRPQPSLGVAGAIKDFAGKTYNAFGDQVVADTIGWGAYKAMGGGASLAGALSTLDEGPRAKVALKFQQYVQATRQYEEALEYIDEAVKEGRFSPEKAAQAKAEAAQLKDSFEWSEEELEVLNSKIKFRDGEYSVADLVNVEERARYWKDLIAGNEEKGIDNFLGTNKYAAGGNAATDEFKKYLEAEQAKDGYEDRKGFDRLFTGLGNTTKAVALHPRAVLGEAAEEIIDWIGPLKKVNMVASTLNEGLNTYDEGVKARAAKEGQITASDMERLKAGGWASAGAAAEFLGDTIMSKLLGATPAGKIGEAIQDSVAKKVGAGAANKIVSTTGRIAGGHISEGLTEAFQGYTEQKAKDVDKINETDIWFGAGLGAGAGGVTTAANELAQPIKNLASAGADYAMNVGPLARGKEFLQGRNEDKKYANLSIDDHFDVYRDTYNPARIIQQTAQAELDTSNPEAVQQRQAELDQYLERATDKLKEVEEIESQYQQAVEDLPQYKENLEKVEGQLAIDPQNEKLLKIRDDLVNAIQHREALIKDNPPDKTSVFRERAEQGLQEANNAYLMARKELAGVRKKQEADDVNYKYEKIDTNSIVADVTAPESNFRELVTNVATAVDKVKTEEDLLALEEDMQILGIALATAHTTADLKMDVDFETKQAFKDSVVEANEALNQARQALQVKKESVTEDGKILESKRPDNKASKVLSDIVNSTLEDVNEAMAETVDEVQLDQLRMLAQVKRLQADTKNKDRVNADILYGNEDHRNLGIKDYEQLFQEAITTGDARLFERTMDSLEQFVDSHNSKAAAVTKALENARSGNPAVYVVRDKNNKWIVTPTKFTAGQLRANGGLKINPGSFGLVETIQSESDLLSATFNMGTSFGETNFPKNKKRKQRKISYSSTSTSAGKPTKTKTATTSTTTPDTTQPTDTVQAEQPVQQTGKQVKPASKTASKAVRAVDMDPQVAANNANNWYNHLNKRKGTRNIFKAIHNAIRNLPFTRKEYDADPDFSYESGNYVGDTADIVPELANTPIKDFVPTYEKATRNANKFIGFGSERSQAGRTQAAFGNAANPASNYAMAYEADDVVFVHAAAPTSELTERSFFNFGFGFKDGKVNTNSDAGTARRLELTAAMAAGATITMLPSKFRDSSKHPEYRSLDQAVEFMLANGYVMSEDGSTFTKDTSVQAPQSPVETQQDTPVQTDQEASETPVNENTEQIDEEDLPEPPPALKPMTKVTEKIMDFFRSLDVGWFEDGAVKPEHLSKFLGLETAVSKGSISAAFLKDPDYHRQVEAVWLQKLAEDPNRALNIALEVLAGKKVTDPELQDIHPDHEIGFVSALFKVMNLGTVDPAFLKEAGLTNPSATMPMLARSGGSTLFTNQGTFKVVNGTLVNLQGSQVNSVGPINNEVLSNLLGSSNKDTEVAQAIANAINESAQGNPIEVETTPVEQEQETPTQQEEGAYAVAQGNTIVTPKDTYTVTEQGIFNSKGEQFTNVPGITPDEILILTKYSDNLENVAQIVAKQFNDYVANKRKTKQQEQAPTPPAQTPEQTQEPVQEEAPEDYNWPPLDETNEDKYMDWQLEEDYWGEPPVEPPKTDPSNPTSSSNTRVSNDWSNIPTQITPINEDTTLDGEAPKISGIEKSGIFTQTGNTVLSSIKNILSGLIKPRALKLLNVITEAEITKENERQLNALVRLQELIAEQVVKSYVATDEPGNNYMFDLLIEGFDDQGNPILDENTLTGMAVTIFRHIQKQGHSSFRTEKEVKALLGLHEDAVLPPAIYKKYNTLGTNRQNVVRDLGNDFMALMGIKPTKDATVANEHELAASVGMMLHHIMENHAGPGKGLVVTHTEKVYDRLKDYASFLEPQDMANEIKKYIPDYRYAGQSMEQMLQFIEQNKNSFQMSITYTRSNIKVIKDGLGFARIYPNGYVLDILRSSQMDEGSKDLINALFAKHDEKKEPLEDPMEEVTQTRIKNTRMKVPFAIKNRLKKAAQFAWGVQADRADALIALYDSTSEDGAQTGREAFYRMFGIGTRDDVVNMHPDLQDQKLAEWEIRKEALDEKVRWLKSRRVKDKDGNYEIDDKGNFKYKRYFMKPVTYVNHRNGYEATLWNAQTDLFDRTLTTMEDWKTTVKTRQPYLDADGNPTKHGFFLLAVAADMEGITKKLVDKFNFKFDETRATNNYKGDTATVDKIDHRDFLPVMVDYLENDEELRGVLDVVDNFLADPTNLSQQDRDLIRDFIDKMGGDPTSFGALVELAKYREAFATGGNFETAIGIQSDGITNGPVSTQTFYGVAEIEDMMRKGGLLTDDADIFVQRRAGEPDYYEENGTAQRNILDEMLSGFAPDIKRVVAIFNSMDSRFGERSGAKDLVTPFNYGAGFKRLRAAIADAVQERVDKAYYKIYELYHSGKTEEGDAALAQYNQDMQEMFDRYNRIFVNKEITEENKLDEVINMVFIHNANTTDTDKHISMDNLEEAIKALKSKYRKNRRETPSLQEVSDRIRSSYSPVEFTPVTKETMGESKNRQIDRVVRDLLKLTWGAASVQAVQSTAQEYIEVRNSITEMNNNSYELYATLRDSYIKQLGLNSIAEMTLEQVEEMNRALSKYTAVVRSPATAADTVKENAEAGLFLSDNELTPLGTSVKGRFKLTNVQQQRESKSATNTTQIGSDLMFYYETNPGVRGMALQIQSTDSWVSMAVVAMFPVINLHDSGMTGLDQYMEMTKLQNQTYFEMLYNYDAHVEMLEGFLRPMRGLYHAVMNTPEGKAVPDELMQAFFGYEKSPENEEGIDIANYASNRIREAFETERTKLRKLLEVKTVHQFGGHGGQYTVTDRDRKNIENRLKELDALEQKLRKDVDDMFKTAKERFEQIPTSPMEVAVYTFKGPSEFKAPYLPGVDPVVAPDEKTIFDEIVELDPMAGLMALSDQVMDNTENITIQNYASTLQKILAKMSDKGALTDKIILSINKLMDKTLANVKMVVIDPMDPKTKIAMQGTNKPYHFNKGMNTIYIRASSGHIIDHTALLRQMFVAALFNNLRAIKNGSLKNKAAVKSYKELRDMSKSLINYISRGFEISPTVLTEEELNYLLDTIETFGVTGRKIKQDTKPENMEISELDSAEALIELALHDPRIMQILEKIALVREKKSIIAKIKDFIVKVFSNDNPTYEIDGNLADFISGHVDAVTSFIYEAREQMTIEELLVDSFSPHDNPVYPTRLKEEGAEYNYSAYEDRFMFDFHSLKMKFQNGPMPASAVLKLLDDHIKTVIDMGLAPNDPALRLYLKTLAPALDLLKKGLGNHVKVVLVENVDDLFKDKNLNKFLNKGRAWEYMHNFDSGVAFYIGGTVYIPSPATFSNANATVATVIHELGHAFSRGMIEEVEAVLAGKEEVKDKHRTVVKFMQVFQKIQEQLANHESFEVNYASMNLDEFISQLLSVQQVRDVVEEILGTVEIGEMYKDMASILGFESVDEMSVLMQTNHLLGAMVQDASLRWTEGQQEYQGEGEIQADTTPEVSDLAINDSRTYFDPLDERSVANTVLARRHQEAIKTALAKIEDTQPEKYLEGIQILHEFVVDSAGRVAISLLTDGVLVSDLKEALIAIVGEDLRSDVEGLIETSDYMLIDRFMATNPLESQRPPNNNNSNQGTVTLFTPREVFDSLAEDTENSPQLETVFDRIVDPLIGLIPTDLLEGYQPDRVWHDALLNNEVPFSSEANVLGFDLSDQQAYVLEIVEGASDAMFDEVAGSRAYRQMVKTYQSARRMLRPQDFHDGDWSQATPEEKQLATQRHSFMFGTPTTGEARSNYLARFVAMMSVSPEFRDILDIRLPKEVSEDQTWFEKAVELIRSIVDIIYSTRTKVRGSDTATQRVDKLMKTLVAIHQTHMDKAHRKNSAFVKVPAKVIETLTDLPTKALAKTAMAVSKLPGFRDSPLGAVTQQAANGNLRHALDLADVVMDDQFKHQPLGEARQIFNEITGKDSKKEGVRAKEQVHLHNFIQQTREKIATTVTGHLRNVFHKDNQKMTKFEKAAVTKVFLDTDMQALLDDFTLSELMDLLQSPTAVQREIDRLTAIIEQDEFGNEYMYRAKALADYMIHRVGDKHNMLAKSPYAIAYRFGLPEQLEFVPDEIVDAIDKVTSLLAMQKLKPEDKQAVVTIYRRETNPEVNGLESVLRTHRTAANEAKHNFRFNPWARIKGYTPNILHNHKSFVVVQPQHIRDYELLGYKYIGPVNTSNMDTTGEKVMMVNPHNGKQRYVTGALSIQDTDSSGTTVLDYSNPDYADKIIESQTAFERMVATTSHHDYTREPGDTGLIPSFDEDGNIIKHRYEMSSVGLDTHLKRNRDFAEVLGQYLAGNNTRQTVPKHNAQLVDFINELDRDATGRDRNKFIEVGPNAPTKKGREYWRILPESTKHYVREVNGAPVLHVRNDMANTLFGFEKYSPSEAFAKEYKKRNAFEKLYVGFFRLFFGMKANLASNHAIAAWQELIQKMKSFEVIRNFDTFMGNVLSNEAFMMINKFNPIESHKHLLEAAVGAIHYQRDSRRLTEVELILKNGLGTADLLAERQELLDSIARNPLKSFIESGMMPTIVNDVSLTREDYSYESALMEKAEDIIQMMPKPLRSAFKTLTIHESTELYNLMATGAQFSDFIYKYAVYKQELSKGKTDSEAKQVAREMFIEYDVPTSKGMQFVNDMGVWTYTKFLFRVQRVLFKFMKERAGPLLMETLIVGALGGVTASSLNIFAKMMDWPFRFPIWDVITMLDEAWPMDLLLRLIGF